MLEQGSQLLSAEDIRAGLPEKINRALYAAFDLAERKLSTAKPEDMSIKDCVALMQPYLKAQGLVQAQALANQGTSEGVEQILHALRDIIPEDKKREVLRRLQEPQRQLQAVK